LNFSLIDKIQIQQLFEDFYLQDFKEQDPNQLILKL
jgi:hypothetical protein